MRIFWDMAAGDSSGDAPRWRVPYECDVGMNVAEPSSHDNSAERLCDAIVKANLARSADARQPI